MPLFLAAGVLAASSSAAAGERLLRLSPAEALRITDDGPGDRAVVLIPGLFGSAFSYRHVAVRLQVEGYRVVVVEPLGVGGSSRPSDADYSLTAQADRIADAMQ